MRIQLKSLTGDIYNIQNAQTWETIGDLKLKVSQTYGIHVEEQKLIVAHLSSGDFVPADTAMLSQLEIVDGVALSLVIKSRCFYDVEVTASPRRFALKARPTDTVLCLRRQVAEKSGVGLDEQILVWNSQQLQRPEYANCTLERLGFSFEHTNNVNLTPKRYDVVVTGSPRSFVLQMKPTDTVLCLRNQVAEKSGVRLGEQILVWNSKQLQSHEYAQWTLKKLGFTSETANNVSLSARTRGG